MKRRSYLGSLIRTAAIAVTVAAVVQELRKPKEERTWHGKVGFVPYDFRIPTWEQIKDSYWNPDDPTIFTPRPLGIGWGVNVPSLLRWVQGAVDQMRSCCGCGD